MIFIDTAEIIVYGGKGGDGAASFRRENSLKKADLTAEMGQRRRCIPGNRPCPSHIV